MRGDTEVVEFLNEHLMAELTIVNQYFLNSRMLDSWGLPGLASLFRSRSLDEMRDVEAIIDRILYLEGHPNVQRLDAIEIGETPKEMIELALAFELRAVDRLNTGVTLAMDKLDHGTARLLAETVAEEEAHADYFEGQLDAIRMVGIENYLSRYSQPEST